MKFKELIPWSHNEENSLFGSNFNHPFFALQKEMNRMFDNFPKSAFEITPITDNVVSKAISPQIDIVDAKKEIKVTVELPGLNEKDIDVSFSKDMLVIKGEKRLEKEEKKENYCLMERSYGSFQRAIPVSDGIDRDNLEASFKNGVLKIILPKTKEAQEETKKIKIVCE